MVAAPPPAPKCNVPISGRYVMCGPSRLSAAWGFSGFWTLGGNEGSRYTLLGLKVLTYALLAMESQIKPNFEVPPFKSTLDLRHVKSI